GQILYAQRRRIRRGQVPDGLRRTDENQMYAMAAQRVARRGVEPSVGILVDADDGEGRTDHVIQLACTALLLDRGLQEQPSNRAVLGRFAFMDDDALGIAGHRLELQLEDVLAGARQL